MQLPAGAKLADVVKALNAMGATPQDLLAILQAMKSGRRAERRNRSHLNPPRTAIGASPPGGATLADRHSRIRGVCLWVVRGRRARCACFVVGG